MAVPQPMWDKIKLLEEQETIFYPLFKPISFFGTLLGLWPSGGKTVLYLISCIYCLLVTIFHVALAVLAILWFDGDIDDDLNPRTVFKVNAVVVILASLVCRLYVLAVHGKTMMIFLFLKMEVKAYIAQTRILKFLSLGMLASACLATLAISIVCTLIILTDYSDYGIIREPFDNYFFSRERATGVFEFVALSVIIGTFEFASLLLAYLCLVVLVLLRNLLSSMENGENEKRLLDHSLILKFHESYHHISNLSVYINRLYSTFILFLITILGGLMGFNLYFWVRSKYEIDIAVTHFLWLTLLFVGIKVFIIFVQGILLCDKEDLIYENIRRLYQQKIGGVAKYGKDHSRNGSMSTTDLGPPADTSANLKNPLLKFSVEVQLFIQEIIGSDIKLTAGNFFDINRSLIVKNTMDHNSQLTGLGDTPLSERWLAETLRHQCFVPEKHRLVSCKDQRIGLGQGFLSFIVKCDLVWEPPHPNLPRNVVLKVPTCATINERMSDMMPAGEEMEAMKDMMADTFLPIAHQNECSFYELFKEKDLLPLPQTWYTRPMKKKDCGVIIMEDLSKKDCCTVNIADGYHLSQALSVAGYLGKLHAYSLTSDEWKGKFPPMPKEGIEEWPKMMDSIKVNVEELNPEYFTGKLDRMKWAFDPDYVYEQMTKGHEKIGLPAVLVHGDLWSNNLLFAKDAESVNGAKDDVLAFIDWQVAHPGNLAEDLARILCTSTNTLVRKKHFGEILEHYYNTLVASMPKGTKVPFTKDDVWKAYITVLPYATMMFLFGVPLMTKTPALMGEGAVAERRMKEMTERARDLIDEVLQIYPDGPSSVIIPPFPSTH